MFHSHLNGDAHMFTPESTVDVQLAFGSDIMMVLDECLGLSGQPRDARESMQPHRALGAAGVTSIIAKRIADSRRAALFPIVQGSMFPDLRARLRRGAAGSRRRRLCDRRPFGGRAAALSLEMAEATEALLPRDRPRYAWASGCRRNCRSTWRAAST